jgi:hypothetical protein
MFNQNIDEFTRNNRNSRLPASYFRNEATASETLS